MKKLIIALITIGLGIYGFIANNPSLIPSFNKHATTKELTPAIAYKNHKSNVQVRGSGTVIKVLADDNQGLRHQKFIVRLSGGRSLLIAHNIDLAPKINSLRKGDRIEFYGEYEYDPRGGIVHWTHSDPRGRHKGGWLKYKGKIYK